MFILLDEDNVVIQTQPNPQDGFIEAIAIAGQILENAVIQNGVLTSGQFVNPSLSLDEVRTRRKDYVNEQLALALYSGIEYDGNIYDSTQDSRAAISAEYNGVNNGYILPVDFVWRIADNTLIPFSEADVNNLGHLMLDHGFEQMSKSWALKADIDAATTETEVNAVVW